MKRIVALSVVLGGGVFLAFSLYQERPVAAQPTEAPANGDVNGDGVRDQNDAVYLLSWLLEGGPEPVTSVGNQGAQPNRIIQLEPTAGAPFDSAGGIFFIYQQHDNPENEYAFTQMQVHHLEQRRQGQCFALYAKTPSLGRIRVGMFNTLGIEEVGHAFTFMQLLPYRHDPAWLTEEVTVEVYIEDDDGFDAPDVGGLLVLRGVYPAP